jgi:hypothetical protein
VSDFRLPNYDLRIEVDGCPAGERPNATSFITKLDHSETAGFDYVVLNSAGETEEKLFQPLGL